ncbi:MAG: aminotransferase class III-fold pyridoxal phosphate-dependent enzyme [Vicinamibacterales bacterium]
MAHLDALAPLRAHAGRRRTIGLDDETINTLAATHADLAEALRAAPVEYMRVRDEFADLLDLDEDAQIRAAQGGFLNFYSPDTANPYVALVARGPWLVTLKGAVLYDSGGYGMLGFGHTPPTVLEAMARPQVMANIMTPNLSQLRFDRAIRREVGHTRGTCPYEKFLCLNSGSESVSLASRFVDVNAKLMTDPDGRHAGHTVKRLVVKGSFHGRTERPALYSNSSRKNYLQHLASFRNEDSVIVIPPYDVEALRAAFAEADANNWFIEAMFLEPVMGEGDPGRAVPRAFYEEARALTQAHGSLLLIDSIQAGLRAHGVLSIVDYPGFEGITPPDLETFSKAINGAQYPLSVLGVTASTAALYRIGIYGNTMTANPRALDVASAILALLTPELRANIRTRGAQAVAKLDALRAEFPDRITKVQGTGLLFSCELGSQFKAYGAGSIEEWLREHGLGVIHGGENSLRFTPHFGVTEDELDLLVLLVRRAVGH